jgi:mannose-6-phosphate isomerase
VDESENDKDAMERLMKSITPKVGDVFIVPAKTVHAIGAGCLILEVQEPTDFTIQPERWCGDYKLSDEEMYLGLSKEAALSCFNFGDTPNPKITPKTLFDCRGVKKEALIDDTVTPCFNINRIICRGGELTLEVKDSYSVYIVSGGEGKIIGDSYEKGVKQGDYFLMPAACMGKFKVSGNIELIECY